MLKESLFPIIRPKILLLNFSDKEFEDLKSKNLNIERGWATQRAHHYPSPGYEYDIVIAKFSNNDFEDSRKVSQYGSENGDDRYNLCEKINDNGLSIVFTNDKTMSISNLDHSGVFNMSLENLDSRDTEYKIPNEINKIYHGYEFIRWLLKKYNSNILKPIPSGIKILKTGYTQYVKELLSNAKNKPVSIINYKDEHVYRGDGYELEFFPKHIILPPFKDGYIRIVNEIFSKLPEWRYDLFPVEEASNWIEEEKYWSKEMLSVQGEYEKEIKRHEKSVVKIKKEFAQKNKADKFTRQLLIADDSDDFSEDENLSWASKEALDYLGFNVEIKEKEIKNGKRREDLIINLDNSVILGECKGTVNYNPQEGYVSKLMQHMLCMPKEVDCNGLLIINHDRKRDALSRSLPYEDAKHLWEDAEKITILSTVELFKIIRDVQNSKISKKEAREIVTTPGRVDYKII